MANDGDDAQVDRLFDMGLLLVSILSAALLQYASALMSFIETTPNNTLYGKASDVNFVFRMTTIPIAILLLIWLLKETYPTAWENRLPLRRWLKEFAWAFLGYFLILEILLFASLSFFTAFNQLSPWVLLSGFLSFVFTFFATWKYKRQANPNRATNRRFLMDTLIEHTIFLLMAYIILTAIMLFLGNAPTPWVPTDT